MSDLFDDLSNEETPQGLWEGTIATTVSDFATKVSVVIPGLDSSLRWENCKWQARNDVDFPQRGDNCLVAFSDNNEIWVVAWWPF